MKNRTNCKIIALEPQRSFIFSKANRDGIPSAVLLVPPTPASVGGVRKQESFYNVNCELSGEAHCCASCCVLGVLLHRAASTEETGPNSEPPTPAGMAVKVSSCLFGDLTHFLTSALLLLFISATVRVICTVHFRETASFIQPLNIPLREVVNLTVLWK